MAEKAKKEAQLVQAQVPWDQRDRANFAFDALVTEIDRLVATATTTEAKIVAKVEKKAAD